MEMTEQDLERMIDRAQADRDAPVAPDAQARIELLRGWAQALHGMLGPTEAALGAARMLMLAAGADNDLLIEAAQAIATAANNLKGFAANIAGVEEQIARLEGTGPAEGGALVMIAPGVVIR